MTINDREFADLITYASIRFHKELQEAYKDGRIENYLQHLGMEDLLPEKSQFETFPFGNVIIIGASRVKKNDIIGLCKELGITKDRLIMELDYDKAEKFECKKLQYNPNNRLVLFGPIPHSTKGKGEYSSMINKMETNEGYPKVVRIETSNDLKITKTSLRKALKKEIESGYLAV